MSVMYNDTSATAGLVAGEDSGTPLAVPVVGGKAVAQDLESIQAIVARYRETAQILRLCGRWTEAVEAARKAIALDPHDPCGRNLLVNILLERGEYQDVVQESSSWLSLQPYNTGALEALAKAHWYRGEIKAALRVMNRLLELNPYEPNYRYQRGVLHQYNGAWGLAMEDFLAVLNSQSAPELRARAEEASTSLENWQLRLIAMLLWECPVFRLAFQVDAEHAVSEKGFRLTETGVAMLRFLPQGDMLSGDVSDGTYCPQ